LKKRRIAAEELHARLQEEFSRKAADVCGACRLPMPRYFAGAREGANWRLPPLGECASLCHTILDELVARYAARFDLEEPVTRRNSSR
jgi:hypothetical protein